MPVVSMRQYTHLRYMSGRPDDIPLQGLFETISERAETAANQVEIWRAETAAGSSPTGMRGTRQAVAQA